MRPAAILLTALTLTACTAAPSSGPAGQASTTDRNPISGNRGGSGSM